MDYLIQVTGRLFCELIVSICAILGGPCRQRDSVISDIEFDSEIRLL